MNIEFFCDFSLKFMSRRHNWSYERTRVMGKQSDVFFLRVVMGCLWRFDGIFCHTSLGTFENRAGWCQQMSRSNRWEGSRPLSITVLSYGQEVRNRMAICSALIKLKLRILKEWLAPCMFREENVTWRFKEQRASQDGVTTMTRP
jgi:hypothetical protein